MKSSRKGIVFLILVVLLPIVTKSQIVEKQIVFTGGMFLHSGYIQNSRQFENINGLCSGIGGQGFFHIGKHFRLGSEGYGSTFRYAHNPGYYKLGWGGILTGFQYKYKRFKPMISLTFGGGKVHDLYLLDGKVDDDLSDITLYRVYSNMLVVPAVSLHYALKAKINLAFKIDYSLPLFSDNKANYAYGPRFYMGILFNK
jgi:hypothetical protein